MFDFAPLPVGLLPEDAECDLFMLDHPMRISWSLAVITGSFFPWQAGLWASHFERPLFRMLARCRGIRGAKMQHAGAAISRTYVVLELPHQTDRSGLDRPILAV